MLLDAINLWYSTPGALPLLLHGAPGVGKTARVMQFAEARGVPCEIVIASVRDPSDFLGLPVAAQPQPGALASVSFAPPAWAQRLAAAPGLLFLDEINTAPPAVQAALLRVVLDNVVGDLALHPQTRIIAACNPPEHAAGGWDLAPPLANRFTHLTVAPPALDEWERWLMGTHACPALLALADYAMQYAQARALVAAFLRRMPTHLCESPRSGPYATPRTWASAARLLATLRLAAAPAPLHIALLEGTIGERITPEFVTWVHAEDLPDPRAVLAEPGCWSPDAKRPDRTYATLNAVALIADSPPLWQAAWAVLARAAKHRDLIYMAARTLASKRPANAPLPPSAITLLKDVRELHGLLDAPRAS